MSFCQRQCVENRKSVRRVVDAVLGENYNLIDSRER